MHENIFCESVGSLVDLSKDELKDRLQEASEVGNMKLYYYWQNLTPACQTVTDGSVLTGDRCTMLWAGGGASLPWRQIWSSEDLTGKGRATHTDVLHVTPHCPLVQLESQTSRHLLWPLKMKLFSHSFSSLGFWPFKSALLPHVTPFSLILFPVDFFCQLVEGKKALSSKPTGIY